MARKDEARRLKDSKKNGHGMHFTSVAQSDVPRSRKGKHNQIVSDILGDVENITAGDAVKIPRDRLGSSVQKVRSALSRASKKSNFDVSTAADDSNLYVWRKGVSQT
jgi:hypothetical protein